MLPPIPWVDLFVGAFEVPYFDLLGSPAWIVCGRGVVMQAGSIGLRAGAVRGGVDGAQRADMIEYDIDEVA